MNQRPLLSYCIFSYNQEGFIAETVEAALSQSFHDMEIIISDDQSSDGTVRVIKDLIEAYQGPHEVIFNVNRKNLGVGAHVSYVLSKLCRGEYVILVGGDDCSFERHAEHAVEVMRSHPKVSFIDFSADLMDESGHPLGESVARAKDKVYALEDFCKSLRRPPSFAPGRIIRKDLFEIFGEISEDCPTEDTVIVMRGLLQSGFKRSKTKVIRYRKHTKSLSYGQNIQNHQKDAIIDQYHRDLELAREKSFITHAQYEQVSSRLRAERILKRLKSENAAGGAVQAWLRLKSSILRKLYSAGLWKP